MAQQPHFSGMRRADWLSSPFSPIHPSLIDIYGDWAQSFETFISDRSSIGGPRFAMALPNFEDSHWDSASQYSDDTIVPMLYNVENVVTSDVIVRFNGGRSEFLSEKRILSAMSGYFKRAFSGRFSVASSDVVDLGDEDNAKRICAMLYFMHGTVYTRLHQRNAVGHNLDFHIDLYLLGDQFDIPTLRWTAATAFFKEAIFYIDTPWFPMAVQRVIGPDAPLMADEYLVDVTVKICVEHIEKLINNERFVEMAHAGELADDETMTKLYLALGQRVRDATGSNGVWQSAADRLAEAQMNMLAAETAMGPGPWDTSTLGGQIMAARARNAAWAALTNLALLAPQPTWAPPPAILASQPPTAAALAANPPPMNQPVVAHYKISFTKTICRKASLVMKALPSRFRKT